MLDIKFIRQNPEKVLRAIQVRKLNLDLDKLLSLDEERRKVLAELEELRHKKNIANEEISNLLKEKKDPKKKIQEIRDISEKTDSLEDTLKKVEEDLNKLLLLVPNIPDESVPVGSDPEENKIMRTWGEIPNFSFPPLTHLEISEHLDIIDFQRASKITGSNFILFKAEGATLERALINFMLDLHTKKHGYTEVFVPHIVNRQSMTGTGQLPKLELDMYRLRDDDYFLIPTAEVPLTNIYRDEILEEADLPIYFTAYTPCYRREAGSMVKRQKVW
jgi:seryl-tRNA synthetase